MDANTMTQALANKPLGLPVPGSIDKALVATLETIDARLRWLS